MIVEEAAIFPFSFSKTSRMAILAGHNSLPLDFYDATGSFFRQVI